MSSKDKAIRYRGWPVVLIYSIPGLVGPSIQDGNTSLTLQPNGSLGCRPLRYFAASRVNL